MKQERPRIVVVGAGFGGMAAARALGRAPADIVVIDRQNHHLFQPLLYQVATAALSPADISYPIRSIFRRQKNTRVLMAEVDAVDTMPPQVRTSTGAVSYDFLVLATGSHYDYFGNDDWERFAPNIKTAWGATKIREKILLALERAETETDLSRRRDLLTFVLVGAGPSGVELAGALAELMRYTLAHDFRSISPRETQIILVDALPRILPHFPESLSRKAQQRLESLGVEIRLNAPVVNIHDRGVQAGKNYIRSANVIWTAGVKASPVGKWLNAETDKSGRVFLAPDLSLPGQPNIFVIGDAALVYSEDGRPLPGLAAVAMQQGEYVAQVIERRLEGEATSAPFKYRDNGKLAVIGRNSAIADFGKFRANGFLAWILWVMVHIFQLIGFRNRFVVLFQWAWSYLSLQSGARIIVAPEGRLRKPVAKIAPLRLQTSKITEGAESQIPRNRSSVHSSAF